MQMKIVLVLIIALHLSVSWAASPADLYSGEVAVASQTEEDRNQALPEALMQVLQKLSGERELPASTALDEALDNAPRYLRSYRYARVDLLSADGTVSQELRLVAQFMQAEVDRIVQEAGLPRWRQERPSVQLWVVSMQDVAARRGLPVSWPDLDPEAMQLVDMSLVWGGFTDYLVERGAPEDGVAIVAARREGPQWGVRWNLASGDQTWTWQTSDIDLQNAMAEGIQQMADDIAAANTIAASDQGVWSVDIDIGGLNDAGAYTTCLNYLQNLSLVNDVEVLGANPGRVQFRLQLNASADHLAETFRQGLVLVPAAALSGYDYEFLH